MTEVKKEQSSNTPFETFNNLNKEAKEKEAEQNRIDKEDEKIARRRDRINEENEGIVVIKTEINEGITSEERAVIENIKREAQKRPIRDSENKIIRNIKEKALEKTQSAEETERKKRQQELEEIREKVLKEERVRLYEKWQEIDTFIKKDFSLIGEWEKKILEIKAFLAGEESVFNKTKVIAEDFREQFKDTEININDIKEYKDIKSLISLMTKIREEKLKIEKARESIRMSGTDINNPSSKGRNPINIFSKEGKPFMQGSEYLSKEKEAEEKTQEASKTDRKESESEQQETKTEEPESEQQETKTEEQETNMEQQEGVLENITERQLETVGESIESFKKLAKERIKWQEKVTEASENLRVKEEESKNIKNSLEKATINKAGEEKIIELQSEIKKAEKAIEKAEAEFERALRNFNLVSGAVMTAGSVHELEKIFFKKTKEGTTLNPQESDTIFKLVMGGVSAMQKTVKKEKTGLSEQKRMGTEKLANIAMENNTGENPSRNNNKKKEAEKNSNETKITNGQFKLDENDLNFFNKTLSQRKTLEKEQEEDVLRRIAFISDYKEAEFAFFERTRDVRVLKEGELLIINAIFKQNDGSEMLVTFNVDFSKVNWDKNKGILSRMGLKKQKIKVEIKEEKLKEDKNKDDKKTTATGAGGSSASGNSSAGGNATGQEKNTGTKDDEDDPLIIINPDAKQEKVNPKKIEKEKIIPKRATKKTAIPLINPQEEENVSGDTVKDKEENEEKPKSLDSSWDKKRRELFDRYPRLKRYIELNDDNDPLKLLIKGNNLNEELRDLIEEESIREAKKYERNTATTRQYSIPVEENTPIINQNAERLFMKRITDSFNLNEEDIKDIRKMIAERVKEFTFQPNYDVYDELRSAEEQLKKSLEKDANKRTSLEERNKSIYESLLKASKVELKNAKDFLKGWGEDVLISDTFFKNTEVSKAKRLAVLKTFGNDIESTQGIKVKDAIELISNAMTNKD
ncbi:MAG: hypothetical protein PHI66_00990 [Candidatus Pacebacteria bacterium]|nr:hypothetical protein [Candidatus Paceibacterota bacterium]